MPQQQKDMTLVEVEDLVPVLAPILGPLSGQWRLSNTRPTRYLWRFVYPRPQSTHICKASHQKPNSPLKIY